MPSHKPQKIDLTTEYPCPACGRRGRLSPITLTEAFGCRHCKQIFVVEENGYTIEDLSSNHPYKKAWWWTGQQWNHAHSFSRETLPKFLTFLGAVMVLCFLVLLLATRPPFRPITTPSEMESVRSNAQQVFQSIYP